MVQAVITVLGPITVVVAKKPSSHAQVVVLKLAMPFTASGQSSSQSNVPSASLSGEVDPTTKASVTEQPPMVTVTV